MLVLFRKTGNYSCSFCGKSTMDVGGLVASQRVRICDECVKDCVEALQAPQEDAEQKTEGQEAAPNGVEALLSDLSDTKVKAETTRDALHAQVQELRRQKVSWAKIGAALNMSRQAAWERFS